MQAVKYYYEAYGNRELPEEEQGYAMVLPIPASEKTMITDHLVAASLRDKKNIKINFGAKSYELNKKYCKKVFNVRCPLTDELHEELDIDFVYNNGQFASLYEELSNAVGDMSTLREGIKKK